MHTGSKERWLRKREQFLNLPQAMGLWGNPVNIYRLYKVKIAMLNQIEWTNWRFPQNTKFVIQICSNIA